MGRSSLLLLALLCVTVWGRSLIRQDTMAEVVAAGSVSNRLVIFHDASPASKEALQALEAAAEIIGSRAMEYIGVDQANPENADAMYSAGFTSLPHLFITTTTAGIEQFPLAITTENIVSLVKEKIASALEEDEIMPFVDETEFFDLLDDEEDTRPILVKFFEPWCSHCKALKPLFQQWSIKHKQLARFMEVECSANGDASEFCSHQQVTGYPTLKLFTDGKPIVYEGPREGTSVAAFLKSHATGSAAPLKASKKHSSEATLTARVRALEQRLNHLEALITTRNGAVTETIPREDDDEDEEEFVSSAPFRDLLERDEL